MVGELKSMSAKDLPLKCGVYLFSNSKGKVIYVGKANKLRQRVSSYFRSTSSLSPMKQIMVREIRSIQYIAAKNENSALLLENSLIKKFSPMYNVVFKDDKDYLYIRIGLKEKWPTIRTLRRPLSDGNIYLGPYPKAFAVYITLKHLRNIFPFFTKEPGKMTLLERELLEKRSSLRVPKNFADYRAMVAQIYQYLKKKDRSILNDLRQRMMNAVKNEKFELAAELRDQILALENIWQNPGQEFSLIPRVQKFNYPLEELMRVLELKELPYRIEGYDISNIQGRLATGAMVVIQDGEPAKKWYRKFKIRIIEEPDDVLMMQEMLDRRFSHFGEIRWPNPDLVVIDGGMGQLSAAKKVWKKYKLKIPCIALAKKEETIYFLEKGRKPLNLTFSSPGLRLLQHLRDEAHRFSRSYHLLMRSRSLKEGEYADSVAQV